MSKNDPISLEDQIRERMNLRSDAIHAAACDGQIDEHEELLMTWVNGLEHSYVQDRVYEETRNVRGIYEHETPGEEWTEFYENDDGGWHEGIWNDLFPPRRGQQGHDTLLMIYDSLAEFWEGLPPDTNSQPRKRVHLSARKIARAKKRSGRWAPTFKRDWVEYRTDKRADPSEPQYREELVPDNAAAKLFVAVAKLFDRHYTPKNCGAVVDRAKNRRRSPEGIARLRERRRRAAKAFRNKNTRS